MPSIAVEDYLKTIYALSVGEHAASTSAIADRLRVAAGSVTGMVKRLAERGLVEHVPYYGARLTEVGEQEAVRLIRRHRVLELFLVQVLGYTWDRVHAEAEQLGNGATERRNARRGRFSGERSADLHGPPIRPSQGRFVESHNPVLAELEVVGRGIIRRVEEEDPEGLGISHSSI